MVKKACLWVLVIACMAMIFAFSHQPSEVSSDLSDGLLFDILEFLNISMADDGLLLLSRLIRKTAHFIIYALLGALVCMLAKEGYGKDSAKSALISAAVCLLYAVSDEIHQVFIPGRSGNAGDVLLDFIGSGAGSGAVLMIYALLTRRRKNG